MPELAHDVYKDWGVLGLVIIVLVMIIAYLIWEKFQDRKKDRAAIKERVNDFSGNDAPREYVSEKEMNQKIALISDRVQRGDDHFSRLQAKHELHMIEEKLEEGRFAKLEGRMDAAEKESGHLFSQTKAIFEKIDKMDLKLDNHRSELATKIDTNFGTITKILLEKK